MKSFSQEVLVAPGTDTSTQLRQLHIFKAAYDACTPMEPHLPPVNSPLPALLALRTVNQTIRDSKTTLASSKRDLENIEHSLERELSDLRDANSITQHLEKRIESLEREIDERTQKSPNHVARDLIRDLKKKKTNFDKDTGKMIKAFNAFVDNHLAAMLAAEELGGPVVGDMLDVDELALESGFNSQGTLKKQKVPLSNDKRQKRIDEIWGQPSNDADRSKQPWDEIRAAATEMRDLTEDLLNNLVEAESGDGDGDGYVQLSKESAAARFLIRAKVAQFHPRDAQRLKLVDFGKELDV